LTPLVEGILTNLENRGTVIPNVADVRDYLMHHPNMDDLLQSVSNRALEVFGETAQLSLEVYHDPEIKDEYLTLYVRQEKYQEDIMTKIKAVWSAYKNSPDRELGRLFVTTDFDPPLSNVPI
jgi:pterin-4a-carbinolamine dehydratase